MEQVLFPTPNEARDKSMRLVSLDQGETERLFELLLTPSLLRLSETNICPRSLRPCFDTFSECSLTRIRLCSIPPVVVELRCGQQSQWVLSSLSDSKSTKNSPSEPETR